MRSSSGWAVAHVRSSDTPSSTAAATRRDAGDVAGSELVLLAVPHGEAEEALKPLGTLAGKIVVDATNPLLPGLAGLAIGRDDSQGERVQRLVQQAKVVKAFNTVGFQVMANPRLAGGRSRCSRWRATTPTPSGP